MITAEQILYNLHMQLHSTGECKQGNCRRRDTAAMLAPLVHDMITEACAETAEDTRERMVAAAARAVERECAPERLTCEEQLVAFADRAAVRSEAVQPAVVLDSAGRPWLVYVTEDGDTIACTAPGPGTSASLDFEDLLEQSGGAVTAVWPGVGALERRSAEDLRAKIVSDLRYLAEARKDYCGRCPEHQGDMMQMTPTEMGVHDGHATAAWLADIVEGSNDAKGWLPSWRWDEWEARP